MEKMLVNVVEYLALGELENYLCSEHPHQQVFHDAMEREAMMQQLLNRIPAVYMWLAADECPSLEQLSPEEQQLLHSAVRDVVNQKLQQASFNDDPYVGSMSEAFYG
ncbi:MAG: hypothetical protein Q6L68_03865 [Thermostichus sp. DG02_5_bins_236]